MTRVDGYGRIDRTRTLNFVFDGEHYSGHPGDTLASALLAHGVRVLGGSVKLGRPRGIGRCGGGDGAGVISAVGAAGAGAGAAAASLHSQPRSAQSFATQRRSLLRARELQPAVIAGMSSSTASLKSLSASTCCNKCARCGSVKLLRTSQASTSAVHWAWLMALRPGLRVLGLALTESRFALGTLRDTEMLCWPGPTTLRCVRTYARIA